MYVTSVKLLGNSGEEFRKMWEFQNFRLTQNFETPEL